MSITTTVDKSVDQDGFGPLDELGPIDFLCIEFPHRRTPGAGMQLLVHLVDRGIIRVLDLAFVRKEPDGSTRRVPIAELGPEFSMFVGASSGMLDDEDIRQATDVIDTDSAAALIVYENHWAAPLAATLRREGAQLIAAERLPVQAILAALDATERT